MKKIAKREIVIHPREQMIEPRHRPRELPPRYDLRKPRFIEDHDTQEGENDPDLKPPVDTEKKYE